MALITNKIIYDGLELIFNNENNLIYTENPLNPLNLPSYTLRLLYKNGVTPTFDKGIGVQVSQSPNIWDLTYTNLDWTDLLRYHSDLLEVIGANATGVTSMQSLFYACDSLTSVSLFDTSKVTNMSWMFQFCSSLTEVPLFDTHNVTNMKGMLNETAITSCPLFNTSKVTDMSYMFSLCGSLTSVLLFDTSKVTDMRNMFDRCNSLTTVPLFNTSNVTNMDFMFYACTLIKTIPLFDTSKVTDMSFMCCNCIGVESGAFELYQQASTQTNPPSKHINTFYNCGASTQIPTSWGGSMVE